MRIYQRGFQRSKRDFTMREASGTTAIREADPSHESTEWNVEDLGLKSSGRGHEMISLVSP